jgi:hypothetical protein
VPTSVSTSRYFASLYTAVSVVLTSIMGEELPPAIRHHLEGLRQYGVTINLPASSLAPITDRGIRASRALGVALIKVSLKLRGRGHYFLRKLQACVP